MYSAVFPVHFVLRTIYFKIIFCSECSKVNTILNSSLISLDNHYTYTWEKLGCVDPDSRIHHTSTSYNNYIVTFGGTDDLSKTDSLNTLTVLNLDALFLSHIKPSESFPRPRCGHSACLIDEHQILIHGGYIENNIESEILILTIVSTERTTL